MGFLADALSGAGNVLSMPGDYTRGLLAGRVGERVSPKELLAGYGMASPDDDSWLGFARDLGVGALTDPLTYAGGALGGLASKGAFKLLGPMHGGGAEKLAGAVSAGGASERMAKDVMANPAARRLLGEIPEGSTFLPGGNNALPFKTPQGDVVRLASYGDKAPPSRAAIEEMLQPTRNVTYGNYRVERVPFADQVGSKDLFAESYGGLTSGVRAKGFHPADVQPGNVGSYGGKPVLIDPGAVVPHPRAPGPLPLAPEMLGATPMKLLLPGVSGGAAAGGLASPLARALMMGGYE